LSNDRKGEELDHHATFSGRDRKRPQKGGGPLGKKGTKAGPNNRVRGTKIKNGLSEKMGQNVKSWKNHSQGGKKSRLLGDRMGKNEEKEEKQGDLGRFCPPLTKGGGGHRGESTLLTKKPRRLD